LLVLNILCDLICDVVSCGASSSVWCRPYTTVFR